jgi:hypothetical protein
VLVGGIDGLAAVGWLPGGQRTTAVVVGAAAIGGRSPDVVADADVVVATDPTVEAWLGPVTGDRVRRHALLDGPEPGADTGRRIGLVGWSAEEVGGILAGRALADTDTCATWFVDEADAWALWQGPTASPLANRVRLAPERPHTPDLADLAVLLVGRATPVADDVAAGATALGVPVHRGEGTVQDAVAAPASGRVPPTGWTAGVEAGAAALVAELLDREPARARR